MNRSDAGAGIAGKWADGGPGLPIIDRRVMQASPRSLRDRDESDPYRHAVELVQRGRMILDVSEADLEASEAALGPFHPTTWHFRNALNESPALLGTAPCRAGHQDPRGRAQSAASHRFDLERASERLTKRRAWF